MSDFSIVKRIRSQRSCSPFEREAADRIEKQNKTIEQLQKGSEYLNKQLGKKCIRIEELESQLLRLKEMEENLIKTCVLPQPPEDKT